MSRRRRLDDDVPRLPRGRGLRLTTAQVVQIAMVAVALVAVIALQKPCARSVSRFVTSFEPSDAGLARHVDAGAPATPDGVILRGDMTPAELEAAIAKARAEAGPGPVDAGAAPPIDAAPAQR
jgi:hypothetical protein